MEANGDIYLHIPRLVLGARRGLLRRGRTDRTARTIARGPQGTPVEWVEEESYFFKLSAYQDRLLELYEASPISSRPEKHRNEIVAFVEARAERSLDLPHDLRLGHPGARHDPRHVMYVWVDALTNYLTGTGFPDDDAAARASGRPTCM